MAGATRRMDADRIDAYGWMTDGEAWALLFYHVQRPSGSNVLRLDSVVLMPSDYAIGTLMHAGLRESQMLTSDRSELSAISFGYNDDEVAYRTARRATGGTWTGGHLLLPPGRMVGIVCVQKDSGADSTYIDYHSLDYASQSHLYVTPYYRWVR